MPPLAEIRAALRLWWSYTWRQLILIGVATLALAALGLLWVTVGLDRRSFVAAAPWLSLLLMFAVQVETFRRLIRVYRLQYPQR